MKAKHLLSFGIDDPKKRLVAWGSACVASSVLLVVFWPLGAFPFLVLFGMSIRAAKKAL